VPAANLSLPELQVRCRAAVRGGRWWEHRDGVAWNPSTRGKAAVVYVHPSTSGFTASASIDIDIDGHGLSPEDALRTMLRRFRTRSRQHAATLAAIEDAATWT